MEKYVIDDNMIMLWRAGCIRAANTDPNDSCEGCKYFNKFCDFNDDTVQKMFQSNPLSEEIKNAKLAESIRWQTALNTLIATESKRTSKETVDMVYSYRVAQIIESLRGEQP